jgi:hypothetical protein
MKPLTHFLLVIFLLGFMACTKPGVSDAIAPDTGTPQAGYVSGRVVDWQNNPIKGAEIIVNNTGRVTNNLVGYTDATGRYRIKLETGGPLVGSYYVRGHTKVNFQGLTYNLALFVEDDSAFSPEEGAVKNLTLKVAGPRSNFADSGYYGGTLEVDNHSSNAHFPNIEVTLEEIGPLADGSNRGTQVARPDWLYAYNVPVGKYRITARDVLTNKPLAVRNYYYDKTYQASTTGIFEPILADSDRYKLVVEVADQ